MLCGRWHPPPKALLGTTDNGCSTWRVHGHTPSKPSSNPRPQLLAFYNHGAIAAVSFHVGQLLCKWSGGCVVAGGLSRAPRHVKQRYTVGKIRGSFTGPRHSDGPLGPKVRAGEGSKTRRNARQLCPTLRVACEARLPCGTGGWNVGGLTQVHRCAVCVHDT